MQDFVHCGIERAFQINTCERFLDNMGPQCFMKIDSKPPLYGIHNVLLTEHQSSDDLDVLRFGIFVYFERPVSGTVVRETPRRK